MAAPDCRQALALLACQGLQTSARQQPALGLHALRCAESDVLCMHGTVDAAWGLPATWEASAARETLVRVRPVLRKVSMSTLSLSAGPTLARALTSTSTASRCACVGAAAGTCAPAALLQCHCLTRADTLDAGRQCDSACLPTQPCCVAETSWPAWPRLLAVVTLQGRRRWARPAWGLAACDAGEREGHGRPTSHAMRCSVAASVAWASAAAAAWRRPFLVLGAFSPSSAAASASLALAAAMASSVSTSGSTCSARQQSQVEGSAAGPPHQTAWSAV